MAEKTLILGDIHGEKLWEDVIKKEQPDKVIFIGDYFDSFHRTCLEQLANFERIIEYKRLNMDTTTLLVGNHDLHYYPEIGFTGTSGYQWGGCTISIEEMFNTNRKLLQAAHMVDNILFTHAGLTETWLQEVLGEIDIDKHYKELDSLINSVWEHKPKAFVFVNDRSGVFSVNGDNIYQSPMWVRPKSLMQDSKKLAKHIIQVVGHTQQKEIEVKGKYYFIDALWFKNKQYLMLENKKLKINSLHEK